MPHTSAHTGDQHPPLSVASIKLVNHPRVLALAEVDLGCGVTLRNFQVLAETDKSIRVNGPASQSVDRHGVKSYSAICGFHPAVKAVIDTLVIQAFRDALAMREVARG